MNEIIGNYRVIGVSRGNEFSPNHVGNDAAIFNKVVEVLQQKGCHVDVMTERELVARKEQADFVFDMARDTATLDYLKRMEAEGAWVVNSAHGITNCVRKRMTELLVEGRVPHPRSWVVRTDEPFAPDVFPCWIKRGNSHAMVKEDVVFVESREEAEMVMADFRRRNIPEAVVNEHLVGDLIKFYGVLGTDFFYTFYPSEQSHSKFGLEAINGAARGYPFDREALRRYSSQAAEVLRVPIYGGDCVVAKDGSVRIIDFNDWPSFARCREEAAPKIAECIYHGIIHQIQKNHGYRE